MIFNHGELGNLSVCSIPFICLCHLLITGSRMQEIQSQIYSYSFLNFLLAQRVLGEGGMSIFSVMSISKDRIIQSTSSAM